jgi:predicted MFS family arabinose efflux permease
MIYDRREIGGWASAIALGVAGGTSLLALPVLISALTVSHEPAQVVASFAPIQSWSISVGCLASVVIGRRFPARMLSLFALAGLICADMVTSVAADFGALLLCRAVAGVFGGLAMSLSAATLTRLPNPERGFGLSVLAQLLFAMVSSLEIPYASARFGLNGAFLSLAVVDLAALCVVATTMPRMPAIRTQESVRYGAASNWAAPVAVLLAIVCFYVGIGACWSSVGRVGTAAGLTAEETGRYLSLAAIGGVLGSVAPGFLMARAGRAVAMVVPVAALLAAMTIMAAFLSREMFLLATTLYYFGWYGFVPCLFGLLGVVDRDGRPSLASMGVAGAGVGIGSALAARGVDLLPAILIGFAATGIAVLLGLSIGAVSAVRSH